VVPGCRDQADADQHALQEAVVDTLPLATDAPLLAVFLCRLHASYMPRSLGRARRRIRIRIRARGPSCTMQVAQSLVDRRGRETWLGAG